MTRVALLNLPHNEPVIRRFRCSYRAQNFLFPPYELLSIGGTLKAEEGIRVELLDAIAESADFGRTADWLKRFNPEIVIFQPGFEILADDLDVAARLKQTLPHAHFTAFGYLPTNFTKQFLGFGPIDAVIMGEPEITAKDMVLSYRDRSKLEEVNGLAIKTGTGLKIGNKRPRIESLDVLPMPDYSLVNLKSYRELMLPQPVAVLQSSRGCPHKCTYCVKPYGDRMVFRSVGKVVEDIERLASDFSIRTLRFEDDVFTSNKSRVLEFCDEVVKVPNRPDWTCLARPEDIDQDVAEALASGGCARVYLGVEHVVPKLLEYLGRENTEGLIEPAVKYLKKAGMEVVGFFLVGVPGETEQDFDELVKFAKGLRFDYIGVSTLIPYPGTQLFSSHRKEIEFNLYPFVSRFEDSELREIGKAREKRFYSSYMYSPRYMASRLGSFIRNPVSAIEGAFKVTYHLLRPGKAEGKHGDLI